MRLFFVALLFLTLSACGASLGDRIDSKNLHVYYMDGVSAQEAVDFATYWRDNGFVGDQKQTIQLIRNEYKELIVKLIEDKKFEQSRLSLDEQAMLSKLARTLEKEVFTATKVRVVPCDNTFRPLVKQ
ncbi:hypothetical protein SAMN05216474_0520 [Lishizhenia tianjinensis]|uniref:Uncharacterized protein n=1 Tax=Lishizhenia tianjinensis TaxID=477690 RepID=A0A1I6XY59_9FLAO|nr:hypothetical protein [Lishizhenia tianjinensis]SFT43003.1 hypothetical protein SAMN05216474_0520 [Lishizhenia tianjinensis]